MSAVEQVLPWPGAARCADCADCAHCTILCVSSNRQRVREVEQALSDQGYRIVALRGQAVGLREAMMQAQPDLALLDAALPGMAGYEVLKHFRALAPIRCVPVLMLLDRNEPVDVEGYFAFGISDLIEVPVQRSVLLSRVGRLLDAPQLQGLRQSMAQKRALRVLESDSSQCVAIRALTRLTEIRDQETGQHILRTQSYVRMLAAELRMLPKYQDAQSANSLALIEQSAPLHDIGKVGIPDQILLKPGQLTAEEREIMQTHALIGARTIALAESDAHRDDSFLKVARDIAHWRHERWDGKGYPDPACRPRRSRCRRG